jgi:hypothetical protein
MWQALVRIGWIAPVVFLAVSAALSPRAAIAGAWTQPESGGYAKLWARWQAADLFLDSYTDGKGTTHHFGDYNEVSLQSYVEYGFVDGLTGVMHFPLAMSYLFTAPNTFAIATVGDPSLGLRARLFEGWFVASAQLLVTVPIASGAPQHAVVDKDTGGIFANLKVGRGVFDIEPRLQLGKGFAWGHVGFEVGYQAFTGGFRPRLLTMGEVGYRIDDASYFTLRIVDLALVGTTSVPYEEAITGQGNGTAYAGFSAEFDYKLRPGLSVGAALEGGIYVVRQSVGPVFDIYLAATF